MYDKYISVIVPTYGGSGCGSSGRSHRRRISTTSWGLIENRPHSILAEIYLTINELHAAIDQKMRGERLFLRAGMGGNIEPVCGELFLTGPSFLDCVRGKALQVPYVLANSGNSAAAVFV